MMLYVVAFLILAPVLGWCASFTVLYDDFFQDQIYSTQLYTQNTTKFIRISRNSSLQSIMKLTYSGRVDDVYLTFVPNFLLPHYYDESAFFRGGKFNFKDSLTTLRSSYVESDYSQCFNLSPDLRRSLTSLVYSIFLQDIAIVTDSSVCSVEFYASLVESLKCHRMYQELKVKIYHVTHNVMTHQDQNHILFFLKSQEISLIITLLPSDQANEFFNIARHFALLGPSQFWLIPDFTESEVQLDKPTRMLTFSSDQRREKITEKYKEIATVIQRIMKSYDGFELACSHFVHHYKSISLTNCLQSKMFQLVQETQHSFNIRDIELMIRYRNLANKDTGWFNVSTEIIGDEFLVHDRDISLLRPITNDVTTQKTIRAVSVEDNPYSFRDDKSYDQKTDTCMSGLKCSYRSNSNNQDGILSNGTLVTTCCIGYVIELLQKMLNDLDLQVDLYLVEDGKYGAEVNGSWDGIIRDLVEGKAEIGAAGLSITGDRAKAVDFFTSPWYEIELGILVKPKITVLKFWNFEFIAPLGVDLQITLWIAMLGVIVVVFLIENNQYVASLSSASSVTAKYYPLRESVSYIGGVTLQRDLGGINPRKPGARVASIVFAFGMVVVVTTYTALLVEQGVRRDEKDPFLGSKDPRMRNPTSEYTFGTVNSSSYQSYFSNSEVDVFRRISHFMKPYLFDTTSEGVQAVKDGTVDALLYDYDFLVWSVSRDRECELEVQKDSLIPSGLSLAFRKDFQWYSNFDQAILRYRESEELQQLYRKWFFTNGCEAEGGTNLMKIQLGLNHFGGLFLLLIGCIVFSFPLLIPEYLYTRFLRGMFANRFRKLLDIICCQSKHEEYAVN